MIGQTAESFARSVDKHRRVLEDSLFETRNNRRKHRLRNREVKVIQNSAHTFGSWQRPMLLLPDSLMVLGLNRAGARQIGLETRAVLREHLRQQTPPTMLIQPKRSRLFCEQRVPKIK